MILRPMILSSLQNFTWRFTILLTCSAQCMPGVRTRVVVCGASECRRRKSFADRKRSRVGVVAAILFSLRGALNQHFKKHVSAGLKVFAAKSAMFESWARARNQSISFLSRMS